eukprot:Protomagalhaensia_sp_Gyna_25__2820@NODE_2633_length_973_cov_3562_268737_g2194_i0_p1_GENE_NODE_2633_length_973_cov_3562_268737_g2194_i0NODE_2633_length_973_cov_3562_268737_g2194_i0_p1_ORF_typecomplete_len200_score49_42_NODE_2633_length_973_cov_3562_268737_g2194_i0374952
MGELYCDSFLCFPLGHFQPFHYFNMLAGRVFLLTAILALTSAEQYSTALIQPVFPRPVKEKNIILLADQVSGIQALAPRQETPTEGGEVPTEGGEVPPEGGEVPTEGGEVPPEGNPEPTEAPAPESTGEGQEGGEHPTEAEATGSGLQDVSGSETGYASEEVSAPVTSPIHGVGDSAPALFAAPLVVAYLLL